MATAVVAARIDEGIKRRADRILKAARITPTQLVRRVYDYIVVMGEVPTFIKTGEFEAQALVEDPAVAKANDLVRYLDEVFPPDAALPELSPEDVARTLAKDGFAEAVMGDARELSA